MMVNYPPNLTDEEKRVYRNKVRKDNYDKGDYSQHSKDEKILYTKNEDLIILERKKTDREIAKDLKRSVRGIQIRRWRLKRK
jgi:hypothetical protein